jgi:hypothetical protein
MSRVVISAILFSVSTLAAQQPAPEIDSIKKEELKADLVVELSKARSGRCRPPSPC